MHLIALDAKSGRELWKTRIHDYAESGGYSATAAPLALKGKVIVGMAGGEHPVSGFLDAYDAVTGKRLWRFHTIPQPGEKNFGTWAGDSWKIGGVATWITGSYDPSSNTLFWGTSNPYPDYNGDLRKGDNLYSCSVLALDPDTGSLKWHFQFTPHDLHDWDATQTPILIDSVYRDRPRKLMAWAARNGFYYLLDRETGQFLFATPFVRQTWARGFNDKGYPDLNPGQEPTYEGNDKVFPGVDGGANWMSHSYSPLTRLLYVFARDERRVYTKNVIRHSPEDESAAAATVRQTGAMVGTGVFGAGGNLVGGGAGARPRFTPEESWGKVVAIEPLTGDIKWEHKVISPPWGGVMSSAGNLVFGGTTEGVIFALDARTGERLWHFQGNERVYATPISFLANGKQYVSVAVGDVLVTFGL
jgi:alcohol dehydrogenase (cytochrome c)